MLEQPISAAPAIIACVFVLFDVVSGLAKAAYNGDISSQKMRKGLWSKCANVMLIVLSMICSVGVANFPSLPSELSSVYEAICAYVSIMEIVSIIENVCEMNPELAKSDIMKIFNVSSDTDQAEEGSADEDNEQL